ncbi:hypothetical protein AYK25_04210 [Thermoplasmatales archaeon SM1-50]|nr:MAG: hypothetical protein AYK25_04210 [Thermoplasmatales archaeon SM1-50]
MNQAQQGCDWLMQDLREWWQKRRIGQQASRLILYQSQLQFTRYRTLSLVKTMILVMVLVIIAILGVQMFGKRWL